MASTSRRNFVVGALGAAVGAAVGSRRSGAEPAAATAVPPAAPAAAAEVRTGGSRLVPVVGGRHQVWTKKVAAGPLRMLTLHGGPGFTHEYFECFEDFLPQRGVEFHYYDQLDSHYSDQPGDASLWTVERYREEVEEVRAALGLERFVLYGHSWGGMLAIEYALRYGQHLAGLVISNMTASVASYMTYAAELRGALPADVIAILDRYEAKGEYEAPEYQETMLTRVYTRHLCRLDPWPEPLLRAFRHFNTKVYNVMQGPNEFVITGNFKHWDRWRDLASIAVPTLVLGARHDTMNPADLRRMATVLPNARVHICEQGSHLALYDDQQSYMAALTAFLADLQAGRAIRES